MQEQNLTFFTMALGALAIFATENSAQYKN